MVAIIPHICSVFLSSIEQQCRMLSFDWQLSSLKCSAPKLVVTWEWGRGRWGCSCENPILMKMKTKRNKIPVMKAVKKANSIELIVKWYGNIKTPTQHRCRVWRCIPSIFFFSFLFFFFLLFHVATGKPWYTELGSKWFCNIFVELKANKNGNKRKNILYAENQYDIFMLISQPSDPVTKIMGKTTQKTAQL